ARPVVAVSRSYTRKCVAMLRAGARFPCDSSCPRSSNEKVLGALDKVCEVYYEDVTPTRGQARQDQRAIFEPVGWASSPGCNLIPSAARLRLPLPKVHQAEPRSNRHYCGEALRSAQEQTSGVAGR